MRRLLAAICAALMLASCSNLLSVLNPPSLVEDDQTSMAIEAFLFRTEDLAQLSGFGAVNFVRDDNHTTKRRLRSALLIPPDRDKIPYTHQGQDSSTGVVAPQAVPAGDYAKAISLYIQTGSEAAQLICTQFMMGIFDRGQYFQFVRSELNAGVSLTQAIFQLAKANGTLKDSFNAVYPIVNTGLDNFQNFRYSTVNDETLRPLILQAMRAKETYYVGNGTSGSANLPTTFPGAVNAVNEVEYLCTRQGIAYLLNHGVAQTTITTDPNGVLVFNQGGKQQDSKPGGSGGGGNPQQPPPAPAPAPAAARLTKPGTANPSNH